MFEHSSDRDDLHARIFAWVTPSLRQLPWRDERDPWKILVSEIMLQQTSVHRVLGKWEAFIAEFPTTHACAEAELGDVLRLWQGLGYPRRARNLHSAARVIVSEHAGRVPRMLDELMALPGVGPYTARAVMAFAFEDEAAVVDTNIARVLRRLTGESLSARSTQAIADEVLPEGESWLWNQAMMDLGATVCKPRPMCAQCPIQHVCEWRGVGSDPAERPTSARQARFDGSDRQARGRLMKALVSGSVLIVDASEVMGRSSDVSMRLVDALVDEGLIRRSGDELHL
ncbi:MAG: A/G-specific adenine glycosylase [Actinomycetota bacterium]